MAVGAGAWVSVGAAVVGASVAGSAVSEAAGDFEGGIQAAIEAMLVSPEFLFRVEHDAASAAAASAHRISDVELASRLSLFLWSSIPDVELLQAA